MYTQKKVHLYFSIGMFNEDVGPEPPDLKSDSSISDSGLKDFENVSSYIVTAH